MVSSDRHAHLVDDREPTLLREVLAMLIGEYDVAPDTCREDVTRLLSESPASGSLSSTMKILAKFRRLTWSIGGC